MKKIKECHIQNSEYLVISYEADFYQNQIQFFFSQLPFKLMGQRIV